MSSNNRALPCNRPGSNLPCELPQYPNVARSNLIRAAEIEAELATARAEAARCAAVTARVAELESQLAAIRAPAAVTSNNAAAALPSAVAAANVAAPGPLFNREPMIEERDDRLYHIGELVKDECYIFLPNKGPDMTSYDSFTPNTILKFVTRSRDLAVLNGMGVDTGIIGMFKNTTNGFTITLTLNFSDEGPRDRYNPTGPRRYRENQEENRCFKKVSCPAPKGGKRKSRKGRKSSKKTRKH